MFESAASLEMSALAEALAMFEQLEIQRANASNTEKREIEAIADSLFYQRMEALQDESHSSHRLEIARVESLADERHMAYRANMSLATSCTKSWNNPISFVSSSVSKPLKCGS